MSDMIMTVYESRVIGDILRTGGDEMDYSVLRQAAESGSPNRPFSAKTACFGCCLDPRSTRDLPEDEATVFLEERDGLKKEQR